MMGIATTRIASTKIANISITGSRITSIRITGSRITSNRGEFYINKEKHLLIRFLQIIWWFISLIL
jgi:hypothetical protein